MNNSSLAAKAAPPKTETQKKGGLIGTRTTGGKIRISNRNERRVMQGQVAAACGLSLCGVRFFEICAIVGVDYSILSQYVPKDYRPQRGRRAFTWTGKQLADLHDIYHRSDMTIAAIGKLFSVHESAIRAVAERNGWRKRRVVWPLPMPLRAMPEAKRNQYRKLALIVGRNAAIKVVFPNGA